MRASAGADIMSPVEAIVIGLIAGALVVISVLFFDKILSGSKNISCASCHHPEHGTSAGLALPLGEGPHGLGPDRRPGEAMAENVHERVPRNSPALVMSVP